MRMRLLSPFRSHLNVETSKVLSNEAEYIRTWAEVRRAVAPQLGALAPGCRVEFLHADLEPLMMRFHDVNVDGNLIPPELLRIGPPADSPAVAAASVEAEPLLAGAGFGGMIAPDPASLLFRVFDNTVTICQLDLDVDDDRFFAAPAAAIAALQKYATCLMKALVRAAYDDLLYPLLIAIWRGDERGRFLEPPGSYTGFPDLTTEGPAPGRSGPLPAYRPGIGGEILWANRSLYTHGLAPDRRALLLRHWLPWATSERRLRDEALEPGAIFLGWGHNVFDQPPDSRDSADAWHALLLAQFFDSVLDSASVGLSRFIGMSLSGLSIQEIKGLDATLQDVVSQVQLVTTQFHDARQNLQGSRRAYFNDLAERWRMDVMTENLERKIRIVSGLIERLFQRTTGRNQSLVQLMLFAIGGFSLLSYGLSLSQFALSARPSPADDHVWGLLDAGAAWPPDALIWVCMALLGLLLGVFLNADRRSKR